MNNIILVFIGIANLTAFAFFIESPTASTLAALVWMGIVFCYCLHMMPKPAEDVRFMEIKKHFEDLEQRLSTTKGELGTLRAKIGFRGGA